MSTQATANEDRRPTAPDLEQAPVQSRARLAPEEVTDLVIGVRGAVVVRVDTALGDTQPAGLEALHRPQGAAIAGACLGLRTAH
jgi:hypothetical protein